MKALFAAATAVAIAATLAFANPWTSTSTFETVADAEIAGVYGGRCVKRITLTCDGTDKRCKPTTLWCLMDTKGKYSTECAPATPCSDERTLACLYVSDPLKCVDADDPSGDPIGDN